MKIGLFSNYMYTDEWFLLTYSEGKFNNTRIDTLDDLKGVDFSGYVKVYIKSTSVPVGNMLCRVLDFRAFLRGFLFSRGVNYSEVCKDRFKEVIKNYPKTEAMKYEFKCSIFLLDSLELLKEKKLISEHPLKKHIDKIKDEDIL